MYFGLKSGPQRIVREDPEMHAADLAEERASGPTYPPRPKKPAKAVVV